MTTEDTELLRRIADGLTGAGHKRNEWLTWGIRLIVPAMLSYMTIEGVKIRDSLQDFKSEIGGQLAEIRANQKFYGIEIDRLRDGQNDRYTAKDAEKDFGVIIKELDGLKIRVRDLESKR